MECNSNDNILKSQHRGSTLLKCETVLSFEPSSFAILTSGTCPIMFLLLFLPKNVIERTRARGKYLYFQMWRRKIPHIQRYVYNKCDEDSQMCFEFVYYVVLYIVCIRKKYGGLSDHADSCTTWCTANCSLPICGKRGENVCQRAYRCEHQCENIDFIEKMSVGYLSISIYITVIEGSLCTIKLRILQFKPK